MRISHIYIIIATKSCPANFILGDKFLRSSITPSIYIMVPPAVIISILGSNLKNTSIDMALPANIARPPNLGMAFVCILLLSFGISTAPILGANLMASGVTASEIARAIKKVIHNVLYIILRLLYVSAITFLLSVLLHRV